MTPTQTSVRAQIKNVLGSLMIDAFPNGDDRLNVLVLAGNVRRARRVLASCTWRVQIDVIEA